MQTTGTLTELAEAVIPDINEFYVLRSINELHDADAWWFFSLLYSILLRLHLDFLSLIKCWTLIKGCSGPFKLFSNLSGSIEPLELNSNRTTALNCVFTCWCWSPDLQKSLLFLVWNGLLLSHNKSLFMLFFQYLIRIFDEKCLIYEFWV